MRLEQPTAATTTTTKSSSTARRPCYFPGVDLVLRCTAAPLFAGIQCRRQRSLTRRMPAQPRGPSGTFINHSPLRIPPNLREGAAEPPTARGNVPPALEHSRPDLANCRANDVSMSRLCPPTARAAISAGCTIRYKRKERVN